MRKFCLADKTVNSFVIAVYMPMMCWRNGVLVNWKNDDLLSDAGHCSSSAPAAKYVFYFIGDGMGICQVFGTELFMNLSEDDRDEKLAFTSFPVKSIITTHSASSLVTDSAAAGTALACGAKTNNDMLGVDPEGAELISLADLAKHEGYATGVVSNVAVNHATPGAFYAHQSDRLDYEAISRDLLDANMDFIGGATFLVSKNAEQGAEWWKRACRKAGIHVCHTADEVRRTESGRIVMLSDDLQGPSLRYAIDRTDSDMELSDLTTAAIDFLDRNAKKGFFLMIEGGKIDYACHDNDAATLFQEVADFNRSVKIALEFYRQHPDETLIVVTADHETGGMALGTGHYKLNLGILANQIASEESLTAEMQRLRTETGNRVSWDAIQDLLTKKLSFWNEVPMNQEQYRNLQTLYENTFCKESEMVVGLYSRNERLAASAVHLLNRKAMIGWSSRSHSGAPVPLFALGAGAEHMGTCRDNTDVPKAIAQAMGLHGSDPVLVTE